MGTILALTSLFLSIILYPFGLIISFIKYIYKRKLVQGLKNFDKQMLDIATSIDASGNVVCEDLFNITLIKYKKSTNHFGNRKETISSVLGKNEVMGTLTSAGKILTFILHILDPGHAKKSIDNFV